MSAINTIQKVSVVIPVYNEQDSLPVLIERTKAACATLSQSYEIILVDDGSEDHSPDILTAAACDGKNTIIAVLLNRNYGQHAAIMAGFNQVTGDLVITLDADLQNPPEEIPRLVEVAQEGFDVVGTIRVRRQDSLFRRMASRMVNSIIQKVTGKVMNDYGCMLRAYRRHIVQAMLECHERSTFIPVLANIFARSIQEIEVGHVGREFGESKYSLLSLINLMYDLLTCLTTAPLRMLSVIGSAIAFIGFILAVILMSLRFILGPAWAAEGVFTLFALLFMFIGAQFVGMGLLGEYIGRIYDDVRARPRYFIQQVVRASQDADDKKERT